jgi:hypothetical protein
MPTFIIQGADKENGKDIEAKFEASDEREALTMASRSGLLVSHVTMEKKVLEYHNKKASPQPDPEGKKSQDVFSPHKDFLSEISTLGFWGTIIYFIGILGVVVSIIATIASLGERNSGNSTNSGVILALAMVGSSILWVAAGATMKFLAGAGLYVLNNDLRQRTKK